MKREPRRNQNQHDQLIAADHLIVKRQHGLFHHHGIDLGDGTVAHYLEGHQILRSSFQNFCCGEKVDVIVHANAYPTAITLQRAISRIGEERYNLLFNNCEHFANWCKTGRHKSLQVEKFINTSKKGAQVISQLMPDELLSGFHLMLGKRLSDEIILQGAEKKLKQLAKLRKRLINKLESTLEQAEKYVQTDLNKKASKRNQSHTRTLMLRGQALADELTAIGDLEERINQLLNKSDTQS